MGGCDAKNIDLNSSLHIKRIDKHTILSMQYAYGQNILFHQPRFP